MNINLNLNESQKKVLILSVKDQINDLNAKKAELEDIISQLEGGNQTIQTFKIPLKSFENSDENSSTYNSNWSWFSKINFIIQKENKCLRSKDIIDFIVSEEPNLDRNIALSSVSSIISQKLDKTYKRYKEGKDFFIGLKTWFDENDIVFPQYKKN